MIFGRLLFITYLIGIFIQGCQMDMESNDWIEEQITFGDYGHFMNPIQAFSPDDQWIVYDVRNEDPHIGQTGRLERVNLQTKKVDTVYQTDNQSLYGPGVGAVAYSPVEDQVIFIHGIRNADVIKPYGITRRTGMGVNFDKAGNIIHFDARDVYPPFTIGALRGGTHAHSWSGDGEWITYTYNDDVIARLISENKSIKDLRVVGVMAPWGPVKVNKDEELENNDGSMFSMIISRVTEQPIPGSDDISKAYEDGWVGHDGYLDRTGRKVSKAVAFLGDVRDSNDKVVTEVFVVDLPDEKPDLSNESQLKGTTTTRPQPLTMVHQRRVTYTTDRKNPGVRGPRQWIKSSPDGSLLYFMMLDDNDIVQIYSTHTIGGEIKAITANEISISTAFDIDPSGEWTVYGINEKVYVTSLKTGDTECISPKSDDHHPNLRAIQWSHSDELIAYNRKVTNGEMSYYQIFTLKRNGE